MEQFALFLVTGTLLFALWSLGPFAFVFGTTIHDLVPFAHVILGALLALVEVAIRHLWVFVELGHGFDRVALEALFGRNTVHENSINHRRRLSMNTFLERYVVSITITIIELVVGIFGWWLWRCCSLCLLALLLLLWRTLTTSTALRPTTTIALAPVATT